jgi:Putative zincin peptidase
LPTGYTLQGSISLKNDRRLSILLTILSIPWFILCVASFAYIAGLLGALGSGNGSGSVTLASTTLILYLVILVAMLVAVLVLHELVHGLLFWLYTKSRPHFGFKGAYAYAAAPDWYIPQPQFVVVGLAPLVLISLVGLLALPFTTPPVSFVFIVALVVNATGAIGDLYMFIRLLCVPREVLIEDQGERIRWFAPAHPE